MYLNEILPGNWREDKWPEHIEVSHEASRFKSRRYVPRVNSANKSSANPVDGIWCSHCGWAGVIAQDITDFDEYSEPQFDSLAEDVPTFLPEVRLASHVLGRGHCEHHRRAQAQSVGTCHSGHHEQGDSRSLHRYPLHLWGDLSR